MAQYYLYITSVSSITRYLIVNNSQNMTREPRARVLHKKNPVQRAREHIAQVTSPSCGKACMNIF